MNLKDKGKLVDELQKRFEIPEEGLRQLPNTLEGLFRAVSTPPVIVTFAYDAVSGQLRQINTSPLPPIPEVYKQAAKMCAEVALQFQSVAAEVEKQNVGKQTGMEGFVPERNQDERGDGGMPA